MVAGPDHRAHAAARHAARARGTEPPGDNELRSSIWGNNDVTLWPRGSEPLTASYDAADLQGATPVVSLSGWNVAKTDTVAG